MGADHARKLARVVSGAELVAVTDFDAGVAGPSQTNSAPASTVMVPS